MKLIYLACLAPTLALAGSLHPAQPLRQAAVHGTIYKTVVVNGSYTLAQPEKVCEFNGVAPVYGERDGETSEDLADVAMCEMKDGGKAQVSVLMSVRAAKPGAPVRKTADAVLTVYGKGMKMYSFQNGTAGSEDTTVRSVYLSLTATAFQADAKKHDVYSVELTAEDNQR